HLRVSINTMASASRISGCPSNVHTSAFKKPPSAFT
ncbi:hypothetical protein A2U01_0066142, partial [Trifolium medium]|nr:hypothetical protein [Trifolium medium]